MNLKRYIRLRVRRIIDAAEVPADLVSNREKLLDKMVTLWYKWKKSVERETKALVADFKKTEKAKKSPPKTLLSKADKLYKSIQPVGLAYEKVNQKLQSGNPTSSEMSKIGLSGKVVPIPSGVKGDNLLRSINRNKIPAEDFGGFEISGMKQELESSLAPYYNVATKTLSTKLAAESEEEKLAKPQMTPKAPIMAEPKEPNISNNPDAIIKNFKSSYSKWYSQIKSFQEDLYVAWIDVVAGHSKDGGSKSKALAHRALNTFSELTSAFPVLAKMAKGTIKNANKVEAKIRWESWLLFVSKKFGIPLDLLNETMKNDKNISGMVANAGYELVPQMYALIDNILFITADMSPSQAADLKKLKEVAAKGRKLVEQAERMKESTDFASASHKELMEIKNKADKGYHECNVLAEEARSLARSIRTIEADKIKGNIERELLNDWTGAAHDFIYVIRKARDYMEAIEYRES